MKDNGYYSSYTGGSHLTVGAKLVIENSVSINIGKADISKLAELSESELKELYEQSSLAQNQIYDKLCWAAKDWEEHAAYSALVNKAIEYVHAPAIEHSSNQWIEEDRWGIEARSISNMVYRMDYHIYEDTEYNRETKERDVVAWHLSWDIATNPLTANNYAHYMREKIAGQDRKRFTDKDAMYKYLHGRIKTYSHLFTEISPPIPKNMAHCFKVNGLLLKGYTIEGQSIEKSNNGIQNDGKLSVLERLTALNSNKQKNDGKAEHEHTDR